MTGLDGKQATAVMCFSSGNGGMERSAVRLADTLSSMTPITLMCKQGSFIEELCMQEKAKKFECHAVRFSSRTFSPAMLMQVRGAIRARGVRNVIFFGASELKTLYFAFLWLDINLVVWHGTTKSRPKTDWFHRLVYSKVNYHVAISDHLVNNVKKIVPHAKGVEFKVIYPSFRIDVNEASGGKREREKTLKIVHVGRMAEGKGQIDAVMACASLHESGLDFRLDLVGPSGGESYMKALNAAIRAAPYADRVNRVGFVQDPAVYLEQADILLFPSHGEGMPNAFIEALHFGIPCLAYDNTVFPEYLEMGFRVHLVPDRNIDELSRALLGIARAIEREKRDAKNNCRLAVEYFNVERELDSWRAILE